MTLATTRFQEMIDDNEAKATPKQELKVVNDREDGRLEVERSRNAIDKRRLEAEKRRFAIGQTAFSKTIPRLLLARLYHD